MLLQLAIATTQHPLEAASVLHVIRNAVIAFLAIVFFAGAVVGFLLARFIYRRSGTSAPGMTQVPPPGLRRARRLR